MPASPLAPIDQPGADLPPPRAFGVEPTDLAVDFSAGNRPALVTTLIVCCCDPSGRAADDLAQSAWNLALGARISRLLRIVELTTQEMALTITANCPQAACQRALELALPFARLAVYAGVAPANIVQFPRPDAPPLALRLPTGRDQAAWQSQSYATQEEALAAIVGSLITGSSSAAEDIARLAPLAAAMEEADPLVAFSVNARCPHCAHDDDLPLDLEGICVQKLKMHQRAILRDVHDLATRYGWSEAEVLSVPASRRAQYRQLIAEEEAPLR
jgi:hypothetical protein